MIDTMGIILTSNDKIPPLTDIRAASALPVAGRFRIIDFVISTMANAGIENIGIITESNYSSLMDHVKSGKPWDLDRKNNGLNLLPPNLTNMTYAHFHGDIDMLAGVSAYIRNSSQTYVVLSLGNFIYNMDYKQIIDTHIQSQADVTMVYKDLKGTEEIELSRFTLLEMDDSNRVTDIEVKPYYPKSSFASMDICVLERELLLSIIDECNARGEHDFMKDAIIKKLFGMNVYGYEYKGYMDKIDSMRSYYKNNMLFLEEGMRTEMFNVHNPINTKSKDQSPTRYGAEAVVDNCFISDGCVIEGTVENCILSRGVKIAKGSVIKNSIIMQDSVIDNDVSLDHVVLDKQVHITRGRKLLGQDVYPLAIAKGTVI
jgi:glucose-1-phosphate adenylyltransferase